MLKHRWRNQALRKLPPPRFGQKRGGESIAIIHPIFELWFSHLKWGLYERIHYVGPVGPIIWPPKAFKTNSLAFFEVI